MMSLTIHPNTKTFLSNLEQHTPQSLLIFGPAGVGLLTLARIITKGELLAVVQPQESKTPHSTSAGTISIEAIRGLYEQTRSKHTSRQYIIIDDADRMSHGAQSAFLKLLEEPGEYVCFILTSHQPRGLLPTIHSRVQSAAIQPITHKQSLELIANLGVTDPTKRAQLQFIAEGLPAELTRLIESETYFQIRSTAMSDARDLLTADTYKKLLIIHKYKTNRLAATQLVDSALQIVRRSISNKPQHTLVLKLEQLLIIRERITQNHNISLQLMEFVL